MNPKILVAIGFTILGAVTILPPVLKPGYTIDRFDFAAGVIASLIGVLFWILSFKKPAEKKSDTVD